MTQDAGRLIEAAALGDRQAVAALLEAHLPTLRAYVRLHMGDVVRRRESGSDLVQSVCREVLEHIDRFQHANEAAFARWLYRTAARKIGHRLEYYGADKRDHRREVELTTASADGDAKLIQCYGAFCTPSRNAVAREELVRIEHAFDLLPEHYRQVIVMARILGMSRAEIAAELGKNEAAVGNLLFRALAQFAEALDGKPS